MLWVTAIVVVVMGFAGWYVYTQVTGALTEQLRLRITEDYSLISQAYDRGGEQGMVEFIDQATATRSATTFSFGMFGRDGRYFIGSVTKAPQFSGWGVVPVDGTDASEPNQQMAYAGEIGDHVVVVGLTSRIVQRVGDAVIRALAVAGLAIVAAGLLTAFAFSRGTSFKLHAMTRTLEQVGRGNSDIRLPIGSANDQIDFVSREINGYLDRLAELMATMRNTAIAIAHDLRSPLNRVSILLQDAESSQEPEQLRAALDTVHKEIEGLGSILDTILRISRIEASDETSSFDSLDLAPILRDLAETFEPVLEASGQTIAVLPVEGFISPAFADRRMIQQLLVNLIENAGHYAGQGAHVELALMEANGAPVVVVSDNGPGIPQDKRRSVFEPFFRMSPERNAHGTGLGLALVQAIATRHRARVTLWDNNPGLRVMIEFAPAAVLKTQTRP